MSQNSANSLSTRAEQQAIVDRILSGNEGAFEHLYDLYRPKVHAFVLRRVRDAAEAEDLTQEVFFQVYRCLGSFGGRSNLLTWVFGIANNVVSHYFRHCSRWMVSPRSAQMLDERPIAPTAERQIDAARALDRCGEVLAHRRQPAHQEIFHLRYRDRQSIRAISDNVGKSVEAVKVSLRRSRVALQDGVPELESVFEPTREAA